MVDRYKVKFFLDRSEEARLEEKHLKHKYGNALEYIDCPQTDTQGYLRTVKDLDGDIIIVAFRGSQQLKDWLTDFNAFNVVYPYENDESKIKVHKGFINAYKSVRAQVHKFIKKHEKIKKIFVCGHSLGGALATLCAIDIQYNFNPISIECYPSGNPKVGNKAFVKSYNKRVPNTIRTYMRTDLVPNMPPSWLQVMYDKYYHAGKKNAIGNRNVFIGIKNWFKRKFKTKNFAAELTNHSIALYRKYS